MATLEKNRSLVLRTNHELPSARSFEIGSGPPPRAFMEGVWGFHLRPTPDGGTSLVVRTRGRIRPRWLRRPFDVLFGEPAHFIMQTRQFHNRRAMTRDPHGVEIGLTEPGVFSSMELRSSEMRSLPSSPSVAGEDEHPMGPDSTRSPPSWLQRPFDDLRPLLEVGQRPGTARR